MNELWRKWRCRLFHVHVKNHSIGAAIRSVPKNMDKIDWEWLRVGERNSKNRCRVKMPQRTGSKPFRQIKYDMGGKSGNPPSFEQFWFETHKSGNILDNSKTEGKYDMIKKTIQENPDMEVFDVIESCFGPQNKGRVAGYGGSVKPNDIKGRSTKPIGT
ncbi:Triosephosphate isomerase [Bienertia sinuspersici]